MKRLLTILFFLSTGCLAQTYPDPSIIVDETRKQITFEVPREPGVYHPVIAIDGLQGSPDPQVISSFWAKNDSTWTCKLQIIYLKPEPDTAKVIAKDFLQTGGITADVGNAAGNLGAWIENASTIGFFNSGDWIKYSVNLTGKKNIKMRYAYGLTLVDRKLEVRVGSITGQLIAEMPAQPTGAWNTFIEKSISINADTSSMGTQDVFFVVNGPPGTSYWGNLIDAIMFY